MQLALDVHSIGMQQTGNETYMRNLVENLVEVAPADFDFHYYHTLPESAYRHDGWRGVLHRLRPHSAMVRIPFSFPTALWRRGIDLAHFQYVAPPLCPCPTVVTIHDISFEFFPEYFNPRERMRMKLLIPLSGRRAAHVLTISEYSRRQLIETYRLSEEKVTVTYLGVSPAFLPLHDEEVCKKTARFDLSGPCILGVGNVQPRKNLVRLIRAFAALRKTKSIPHQLVLVGKMAWKAEQVLEEIERLGIRDAVKITGYVTEEELVALYNRADLFVYPSLYEGFGLPIVEAMACGTPVVTSNVTCMPEIAGDAALLVDPLSEEEIGAAILRVIDDPALGAELTKKGLLRSKVFNWRSTAEQTVDIYRKCA